METNSAHQGRTRFAFLWVRILAIPFWAIFNLLPLILYKELHASALECTAMIALKPMSSLLSPYWSLSIYQRQDRLVSNLIWANLLKFLPFLFFPWFGWNWLFILSFGSYMLFHRGSIPAWMEIFKVNIKGVSREKIFSAGSVIDYLGSAILPVLFGTILDDTPYFWRWLFFGTALLGLFSTLFLYAIPSPVGNISFKSSDESWIDFLVKPWKQCWSLLKKRPDFARFQLGFMLGGSGIMIMQPIFPIFFVDVLNLSYTKMVIAISICKGIGYAVASPLWARRFNQTNIYSLGGLVTLLTAIFGMLLLLSTQHLGWLFVSFLFYGIWVAGSDLVWNMSGPHFSNDEDSSLYSRTNVLTVGLRGSIIPLVGSFLYMISNSITVILVGCFLCLLASERMRYYATSKTHQPFVEPT